MHFMKRIIWLSTIGTLLAGCAAQLSVAPGAPRDRSAPTATKAPVSKVMVLPPRGSERGQVSELAELERVLLAKGFRVISSGITGRVASGPAEERVDEAARLSDLERALILAKKSNADALLQVGEIAFQPAERLFAFLEGDSSHLMEVTEQSSSPDAIFVRMKEERFSFQAKVINVDDGEILVSMDISQSTSRVSPAINTNVQLRRGETILTVDTPERRQAAVVQVMEALNNHIIARPAEANAKP
jgi:hypothetical protein